MAAHPRSFVADMLIEYGEAARAVLFDYLPDREPRAYLYDLVGDYPQRGGRAFRPSLCIAVARAFGAPMQAAVRTAASIELIHNAMLIHDDIEDESEERRGRPALHVNEGVPLAINAGDMLTLLSLRPLLDNREDLGEEASLCILEATDRMAQESAEGQAMELGWRRDNVQGISEGDYLRMVLKKTCWLTTIHPLRMGMLIGAAVCTRNGISQPLYLDDCIRFGFFLGAAFQIQDDLLNLQGDHAAYGKEIGGDIYEGKRTLMLIHLLEKASVDERKRIHEFLAQPRGDRSEEDVRWIREQMDHYGSLCYARKVAQGLAGVAQYECEQLFGHLSPSRDRELIHALPRWVLERN